LPADGNPQLAVDLHVPTDYRGWVPKKRSNSSPGDPRLIITQAPDRDLSPGQAEFNRLMKRLENARAKHLREEAKLEKMLGVASRELMPLVEELSRANRDLIFKAAENLRSLKFSAKRRLWLKDLISGKACELLEDQAGLSEEDETALQAIIKEFTPHVPEEVLEQQEAEEFDDLRAMLETLAAQSGLDLDLSDLDVKMDPAEFERTAQQRFEEALERAEKFPAKPARKQTKAQAAKALRLKEEEDAKKRDLKTLYKQLAKALHPDLEADPQLKLHKEAWMKRLTGAYADGDLRELLQIEMEWLGEEATNLSVAGDEKLKVYCSVLKQQIAEQKGKTDWLHTDPKYFILRRFIEPFSAVMGKPAPIRRGLSVELKRHREMLATLCKGGPACRRMMEDWADENEPSPDYDDFFSDEDIPF
jgi:hypothetical protein